RATGGAGVRKPPKEETARRKGAVWSGATYGDLEVGGRSHVSVRGPEAGNVVGENGDDELVRWRAYDGLRERVAWRGPAGVVRTPPSCSGARLEAKAIGVGRREAGRHRS